jgi:large repetitive protein
MKLLYKIFQIFLFVLLYNDVMAQYCTLTYSSFSASLSGLTVSTTYQHRVRGVNAAGNSNGLDQTFFTPCLVAGPAGPIMGPAQVCNGGTGYIYTVPAITNASGYNWTIPFGAIITAGVNTNTITVAYPNPSYSGNMYVYGLGCAGNGSPSNMVVTVNAAATPTLAGPSIVCAGSGGNLYTTQTGMTNYVWTIVGGTITGGGTTGSNTATVTWNTAGPQSISVNYNNAAGCAGLTAATVNVTVNPLPVPTITGNANPCTGLSTVYTTQAGMTGYSWTLSAGGMITTGQGSNVITVVWNTAGAQTACVTYTNTDGCTNSSPVCYAITVKQGPTPTITGAGAVCLNSGYYTYTTQTGMTSYFWSVSAGGTLNSGQGTNIATVSWSASGPQSVSVNYTNANGCAAAAPVTMAVNVTDFPGPAGTITGPTTVCEGGTNYVYSVASIPNTQSYMWIVPTGATIVSGLYSNSITVNYALGASSGNITVYGNNICGNGATSLAYPVTVNYKPAAAGIIIGPNALCQGSTGIDYSIMAITGATGYAWSVPAGATIVAGTNTNVITVNFSMTAVSGDITVYGTNACGNGTISPTLVLTILITPQTPVITNVGAILTSDAPAGNQWYFEGTLIPEATNQTYEATQNGTYWDIVILNGCSSAASNQVQITEIGINPNQGPTITIHPVPNDGKFTISITSASKESFNLSVLNNLGVEVYQQTNITVKGTVEKVIDLRPIPSGIYSVIIRNRENQVIRKILVNQ